MILIPADRADEEPPILERIRRGERIDHFETVRRRKDGSLVDISLTISPIIDERGAIIGASKIARDITQQKQIENLIKENETTSCFFYIIILQTGESYSLSSRDSRGRVS